MCKIYVKNKENMEKKAPTLVFIVPYRDREQQKQLFNRQMAYILEDISPDEYRIFFVEQCDIREFNRGALKNIGFLAIKNQYPNNYKTITFVFNDVDTMPYMKNLFNYETVPGLIKHFYGFNFALGGIASITGGDFEKMNGYPNFWAWGYEDNLLNKRAIANKIKIDRTQFYPILDKNIIQLNDGLIRNVNRTEFDRYLSDTKEGLNSITNLQFNIDEGARYINVYNFKTGTEENPNTRSLYDLRSGPAPFKNVPPIRGKGGKIGMFLHR